MLFLELQKIKNYTDKQMQNTVIICLLTCAQDYSELSESDIMDELEFLEENLFEFEKITDDSEFVVDSILELYYQIDKFFLSNTKMINLIGLLI